MAKNGRVIGFLVEDMFSDFSRDLIESAQKAIPSGSGVRLAVISGKCSDRPGMNKNEKEYNEIYNSIYDICRVCELDGLIIHPASLSAEKLAMLDRNDLFGAGNIPAVLISYEREGFVSVNYDNRTGISQAVDYLVNVDGITKLCMLGGREDNPDACMRKKAFIECLAEHGIEFSEDMYEKTDMSTETEEEAGRLLDRNPEAGAVFCVNDGSAVGLYRAMAKRRLVPGKDILVFGFDNTKMANEMDPPLASVGSDSVSLGQRAIQLLLAGLDGEKMHSELIPTRIYGRGSFEYTSYEYSDKYIMSADKGFINNMFDECFYRYSYDDTDRETVDLKRLFLEIISRILRAMTSRYLSIDESEEINRLTDIFFDEGAMDYTDAVKFLSCINDLQEDIASAQRSRRIVVNVGINRLFLHMKDRAVTVLSEKNIRDSKRYRESEQLFRTFLIRSTSADGTPVSSKQIFENISGLGLRNCAFCLFEDTIEYDRNKDKIFPPHALLVCAVKEGETYILPKERRRCPLNSIFMRGELSSRNKGYSVFPVFFRNYIYGFLISEVSEDIYTRGEYIAMMIGRTIYHNLSGEAMSSILD